MRQDGCTCGVSTAPPDGSHLPGCPVVPMVRPEPAPSPQDARAEAEDKLNALLANGPEPRIWLEYRREAIEAEAEVARLRALAAGWVAYLHGYASTNTDPSVPYPHRGDWTECPWHPCRQAAAILAPATTPAPPAPECICAVASENNPHPNIDCPLREEENHA